MFGNKGGLGSHMRSKHKVSNYKSLLNIYTKFTLLFQGSLTSILSVEMSLTNLSGSSSCTRENKCDECHEPFESTSALAMHKLKDHMP